MDNLSIIYWNVALSDKMRNAFKHTVMQIDCSVISLKVLLEIKYSKTKRVKYIRETYTDAYIANE